MTDKTQDKQVGELDANSHIFTGDITIQAEHKILSELLRPGMKVLDVGCAASGRSAMLLSSFGCEVHAIEINTNAIQQFGSRPESDAINLIAADMLKLPFANDYFDLVLVAFHGMDYVYSKSERTQAFQELSRVLDSAGKLVFNGFNRLGILLNPQIILSSHYRNLIIKHVAQGYWRQPTFIDENNLRLNQASPVTIVREVEGATSLRFQYATNKKSNTRNMLLVTLFASAPYYVFSH